MGFFLVTSSDQNRMPVPTFKRNEFEFDMFSLFLFEII